MATVGLRDLYRAPITRNEQTGKDVYGTPVRMAKAIEADLSVEIAEAILYADDGVDEIEREFVSGELKLKVNDLTPVDLAALLGQTLDVDGVVYAGENDEPPYWAIGFRARKPRGKYKYLWLYKAKFSIPDEKYTTKGDKLEFNTPEIAAKFIKRDDGQWKAEHVGLPTDTVSQAWFTAVREQNLTPPEQG
jgi:phi13 family phage major tail protein